MSDVDITTSAGGAVVTFRDDVQGIVVDARDHDFIVRGTSPGVMHPMRLAASRVGLAEVKAALGDAFRKSGLLHDASEGYLMDALVVAARVHGDAIDDAFTTVDLIARTPLICARGVAHNRHLLDDVVRFRPAAVAVCSIEDLLPAEPSVPEQTEIWGSRLSRWRELFCAPGSVQRSVNRTLARFGDEATPEALWGLRRVVLDAPLSSVQHLEVLGSLGARGDGTAAIDPDLQTAVLRASSQELGEALVLIDEGELDRVVFGRDPPAMRLAEILGAISVDRLAEALDRRVRFGDLLQHAIHALQEVLQLNTMAMAPPIPPPAVRGVRFLPTIGDILREGVEMDHCVATRAPKALCGESYIFHLDHAGERATAEVRKDGIVLEVRGPQNVKNGAVVWGTAVLDVWGARLRLANLGPPSTSLWVGEPPARPEGTGPIATLGELIAVLTAMTTPPEPGDERLWRRVGEAVERAIVGRSWLLVARVAGVPFMLWGVKDDGMFEPLTLDRMSAGAAQRS